jgi:hypothetical protein
MPYLDDKYCQKKFPSSLDRSWSCPVRFDDDAGAVPAGFSADGPLSTAQIDTTTLPTIVSNGADMCVILIRRTTGGKIYNK